MGVMKRMSTARQMGGGNVRFNTRAFFDRQAVIDAVGKASAAAMAQAGYRIMRTAQRSMRRRKGASKPGTPPSVHRGDLKRLMEFAYDPRARSTVVGPVLIGGGGSMPVPRVLELGGRAAAHVNRRRLTRRVGDGGEIRIGGRPAKTTKPVRDWKNRTIQVTYAHLYTQGQADRANEIQEELYGPMMMPAADIDPRPYMGPALERTRPQLPQLWYSSVR